MKRVFGARTTAAALAVASGLAAALALFGVFAAHGAVPKTGPLTVHAGLEKPPGAVVRGNTLVDDKGETQWARKVEASSTYASSSYATGGANGLSAGFAGVCNAVATSRWR